MTAIIDYGVGNLFSLKSSFAYIGQNAVVTSDPAVIRESSRIILPGVGAFGDAAEKLRATGLDKVLLNEAADGKPLMGICLGMQLLFEESFEYGTHRGLGLLHGTIEKIKTQYKIPQIGWNALDIAKPAHKLMKYVNDGDFVYFVHSYQAANCADCTVATTEYGTTVTAAVADKNVCGTQFHPEKSGTVGLNILRSFCEMQEGL